MPVFLERFVLPALAAALIGVILLNPFKFDWQQQVSLGVVVVAMAFFVGYTVHKGNRPPEVAPTTATPTPAPQVTGPAQTSGDSSPANTGNGNSFNYDKSGSKK